MQNIIEGRQYIFKYFIRQIDAEAFKVKTCQKCCCRWLGFFFFHSHPSSSSFSWVFITGLVFHSNWSQRQNWLPSVNYGRALRLWVKLNPTPRSELVEAWLDWGGCKRNIWEPQRVFPRGLCAWAKSQSPLSPGWKLKAESTQYSIFDVKSKQNRAECISNTSEII